MYHMLGFETLTAPQAAVWFALALLAVLVGTVLVNRTLYDRGWSA